MGWSLRSGLFRSGQGRWELRHCTSGHQSPGHLERMAVWRVSVRKFRDELVDWEIFYTLPEVQVLAEQYRQA